jgi:hypothetical protein
VTVPNRLGDPGHGRGESVAQWWPHTIGGSSRSLRSTISNGSPALREKIMRTDTSELSLHELENTEIDLEQLEAVSGGLLATVFSNIANMRHEMLRMAANNLRA